MYNNKLFYNLFFIKISLKWDFFFKNLLKYNLNWIDLLYIRLKYYIYIIFIKIYNMHFNFNNTNVIKNLNKYKYIQKGVKHLGIYIKNFFKKKSFIKKSKNFYWIIIIKRKNLFMTFLDLDGNVLLKLNVGSCGFKKRVKFTGHALNKTTYNFGKKILKYIKKYQKIINSKIIISKNSKNFSLYIKNKFNKRKMFFLKKKVIKINNLKKKNQLFKFNSILKQILKRNKYLHIKKYRNYSYYRYRKWLKKKRTGITIQLMNEISYWAVRYIWYGMNKLNKQYKLNNYISKLEDRIHFSHSKGLRIKKKKRI